MPILLTEGRSSILIAPFGTVSRTGETRGSDNRRGRTRLAHRGSSPDGSILYFLSKRDGFQCIWAQHLDSLTKTPKGPPFAVNHFHGARYKLREAGFGPGIGASKLIFTMSDTTGNIWRTKIGAPR
jgi:hypothetical protein